MEYDKRQSNSRGHLIFVVVTSSLAALYLIDTYSVSSNINNVILIRPAVVVILALAALIVVFELRRKGEAANEGKGERFLDDEDDATIQTGSTLHKALGLMALLTAYTLLLPYLGFDAGTVSFVASVLYILGVRKPAYLIGFPLLVTVIIVGGISNMTTYPMHMLVF